jgi:hypothetical protein
MELALRERLQEIAVRPGGTRPLQGRLLRIGRQVDDRDMIVLRDALRGLDAVDVALDADVHQHQVGPFFLDLAQRLLSRRDIGDHVIAAFDQLLAKMQRDDPLVLHQHDTVVRHSGFPLNARS